MSSAKLMVPDPRAHSTCQTRPAAVHAHLWLDRGSPPTDRAIDLSTDLDQNKKGASVAALFNRMFPRAEAAKVPEIIFLFWVIKILTTAGGEATSDYLKTCGNIGGGGTEVALFIIGLVLQFGTRRYRAFAYWFLAYAIAIFGTGVSDFLHLDVHIPYAGTTLFWAVVLIVIFLVWHRAREPSPFTASPPVDARASTGPPCSPLSPWAPLSETLRPRPWAWATWHLASSSAWSS